MVRTMMRWLPMLAILMMAGCASHPDSARGRFESRAVKVDGRTAYYQVFIPATAARTPGALPVVLFLHGSGERGGDGVKQTHAGLAAPAQARGRLPRVGRIPQVPGRQEWSGRNNRVALAALTPPSPSSVPILAAVPDRDVDGRLWQLEHRAGSTGRFAAIVPVCGAVLATRAVRPTLFVEEVAQEFDPYAVIAKRLRHTPIWIFHGALDDVVPPDDDRRLHAAFQNANARDVRYTEYPEGNHNAWDATYADPAMWAWHCSRRSAEPRLLLGNICCGYLPLVGLGIRCRPLVGLQGADRWSALSLRFGVIHCLVTPINLPSAPGIRILSHAARQVRPDRVGDDVHRMAKQ